MGHDAYMAAAGLVVSSQSVAPSGAVPEFLRPLVFPAFATWAAYDLFWFTVHAGAALALAAGVWLSWRRGDPARASVAHSGSAAR